jgi:tRNA modification GTPase
MLKAALTTSKTASAIAAIDIFGKNAMAVVEKLFEPSSQGQKLQPNNFCYGKIKIDDRYIDDVVIQCGCEKSITINTHGNSFIIKEILELLKSGGAEIVKADELFKQKLNADNQSSILQKEVLFWQCKAVVLTGVKLICNQIIEGLTKWVKLWQDNVSDENIISINNQAEYILKQSGAAHHIIYGSKVVIAGAPNSGKSTLLNAIAGKQISITSKMEGTTRDWVNAECVIKGHKITLIDTAGIEKNFSQEADIKAQEKSFQMLESADVVWLVMDAELSDVQQRGEIYKANIREKSSKAPIITVFNKIDKTENQIEGLSISAINNIGIESLIEQTLKTLKIVGFDIYQPICFTNRQQILMKEIAHTKNKADLQILLEKLLKDKVLL